MNDASDALDSADVSGEQQATEAPPEPDPVEDLRLQAAEDTHTRADWEAAAAAVLRKARRLGDDDADELAWSRLARTTLDGLEVPPLGTPDLLEGLATHGRPVRSGPWDVRAHLRGAPKPANDAALADLDGGVTSLWISLDDDLTADRLTEVLHGVHLDLAPVVLEHLAGDQLANARAFVAALDGRTPAPGTNLGIDPLARAVADGAELGDLATTVASAARLADDTGTLALVVDATAVHDLGASDAQELGYSMAAGVGYLRALVEAGLDVDTAAALIEFRYAATDEQFPTIAKLRAARRLWARVTEASGGAPAVQRQHAVTSRPMTSRYDAYVNMLRGTIAAFAAGVAGADAVTVLPFDTALGDPGSLGRRVARNTSALLIQESHVANVADPAGGSYAVERSTDDLARAGWAELGRIESAGGVPAALEDGSQTARIREVAEQREREIATRTRPITGVSEFPDPTETLPERQGRGDDVRRYAASFEALRDDPPARPVFLATMGSVAQHTARATFATNLLAAGGVAVEPAGATDGVDDVVAAYRSSGSPVVCLAGTDETYAQWGADLVAALRDAGAAHVVLAGRPGKDTVEDVDDSCAVGVDALAFLTATRKELS